MRSTKWLALVSLICTVCTPVRVLAVEQQKSIPMDSSSLTIGDSSTDVLTVPEVTVTATRAKRRSFDIPQDVTIVTRNEIDRRTPQILPDLLEGAEGIFVQRTTAGQANPIIRGLVGSSVLTLVDGMRLNTAFFRSAPNQYISLVDPQNVDSIEVVRGVNDHLKFPPERSCEIPPSR